MKHGNLDELVEIAIKPYKQLDFNLEHRKQVSDLIKKMIAEIDMMMAQQVKVELSDN